MKTSQSDSVINSVKDDTEETPLISDKTRGFVTRVRVVSILVSVLYFSSILPTVPLLSQYIVYRLTLEDQQNGNASLDLFKDGRNGTNICSANKSNEENDERQAQASTLILYCKFAQAIPALFACLLFGGYADIYGRRPSLLVGLVAGFVRMTIYSITILFGLPVWVFYIAHAVDGICGTFLFFFVAIFSIFADISDSQKERVFWMVVLACFTNVTTSIFTLLNGYVIAALGYFTASLFSVGFMAVAFCVAFFLLPETLAISKQTSKRISNNLKRSLGFFFLTGSLRKRMTFVLCMLLFLFSVINTIAVAPMDALYQTSFPFCWSPTLIGFYAGFRVASSYFLAGIFLKLFQLYLEDEYIAMLGMLFQGASFVYEAFLKKTWEFFLVPLIGFPGVTSVPIIRAMVSSLADNSEQGALFSSISAVEAICNALANTAVLQVYAATVSTMPGATYLVLASFSFSTFFVFLIYLPLREKDLTSLDEGEINIPAIPNPQPAKDELAK